jgi:hypothetical protein
VQYPSNYVFNQTVNVESGMNLGFSNSPGKIEIKNIIVNSQPKEAVAMIKKTIKVKVKQKVKGVARVLVLLLGVYGVHHAQPYKFS